MTESVQWLSVNCQDLVSWQGEPGEDGKAIGSEGALGGLTFAELAVMASLTRRKDCLDKDANIALGRVPASNYRETEGFLAMALLKHNLRAEEGLGKNRGD